MFLYLDENCLFCLNWKYHNVYCTEIQTFRNLKQNTKNTGLKNVLRKWNTGS